MNKLLNREAFRDSIFHRDSYLCVKCGKPATDAHHIMDRSLWDNGGYYVDNGASLCSKCHILAEKTIITCDELRKLSGINNILLPEHLCTEDNYDKWGNILLPSGNRIKGELFIKNKLQELLPIDILSSFLQYTKYPRTFHLPWSPNLQNDDRQHKDVHALFQRDLVATIKMDGENTSFYSDYIHARSLDSVNHPSRTWIKALHGRIAHEIPEGWRICGENLYAKHSIHYHHLKDYFYVFSIWNEKNEALCWRDTVEYCDMLGLHTVPVFHTGITCESIVQDEFNKFCSRYPDEVEGYVLRVSDKIPYHLFKTLTAKYVRANHVRTDKFWMTQPVIPNKLEEGPIYNTEEILHIKSIIIDKVGRTNELGLDIIDFILNYSQTVQDCIAFKYTLISQIKEIEKDLERYESINWSNTGDERGLEALRALHRAIFCDFKEVPLNINKPLKEITAWRLEHGK